MQAFKSFTVSDRISQVQTEIESNNKTINCLLHALKAKEIREKSPYAPRVIKYSRIPFSEKRFQWTLQHLKTKVQLLERELETLQKYY